RAPCALAVAANALEAARAVHRLVRTRLERHVGRLATFGARRRKHLARCARVAPAAVARAVRIVRHATARALGLTRRAALRAATGLVGEALLREKLLLAGGEGELATTIPTDQCLVLETHETLLETELVKAEAS